MGQKATAGLVGRVLNRAGYVSAARARELSDSLARAEARIEDLRRALDEARAATQALKDKTREREERSQRERAEDDAKHQARVAKMQQKAEHEVKRLRERDTERGKRLQELRDKLQDAQQRIAWAEKSTQLGREHLMAIETKLDIVEGAIKVLDQRTRAALSTTRDREPARAPARLP